MPPRRSVRRNSSNGSETAIYKPGDTVEFNTKGSTSKGKIVRKSPNGSTISPLWIVSRLDRGRKHEIVPEKAIEKLIQNESANSNPLTGSSTSSITSSYSDDNTEEGTPQSSIIKRDIRWSGIGSGSPEEQFKSRKKRKSNESCSANNNSRKVTFHDGKRSVDAATKQKQAAKKTPASRAVNMNTRSTRASGGVLMSELPLTTKPKKLIKTVSVPKKKKNENVKVIKMLTGTLYLYRGETRKAQFFRSKY